MTDKPLVNPLTTPLDTPEQVIARIEEMGGLLYYSHQNDTWVLTFPERVARHLGLSVTGYYGMWRSPMLPGMLEICRLGG